MLRFRKWLDENDFDGAYGRSVPSQYPTKLNKNRYKELGGDWRRAKANIKCKNGKRSRGLDKLSALYLRTGLWMVFPRKDQVGEGLKILMPTESKLKQMKSKEPEWTKERLKFSRYE